MKINILESKCLNFNPGKGLNDLQGESCELSLMDNQLIF